MSVKIGAGFKVTSASPIDDRFILTREEMLNVNDTMFPDVYITLENPTGEIYIYNKTNEIDSTTGKFRPYNTSASPISFEEWKPDTEYKVDDYVTYDSCLWICTENHISGAEFVGEIENITTTNYILKDSDGLILKDSTDLLLKDTVKTVDINSYWRLVIGVPTEYLKNIFLTEDEMTLLLDDIF